MSYNCYAYSIGRNENPPQYSTLKQYQPGDFSRTSFSMSLSISQMASVVQKDLEALGFSDISLTTSQPSVQTGEKLICIRKGSSDYHFMRYDSGSWYHKPGFTSILKYNYQPTNSRVWIGEYVDMYGNAYLSSTTYNSDIYFIKYSESPFTISVTNNSVTITGVKQGIVLSGSVTIPSTMNGMPVVAIGNSAFSGQAGMSQISIPASITSIGSNAFAGCSNLTIYTDWDSPSPGWATNWNPLNRPVVWGTQHTWRSFSQINLNTLYHNARCACGVIQMQYHRYEQLSWNKVKCIDCGFECDPNTSILPPLFTLSPKPNINVK